MYLKEESQSIYSRQHSVGSAVNSEKETHFESSMTGKIRSCSDYLLTKHQIQLAPKLRRSPPSRNDHPSNICRCEEVAINLSGESVLPKPEDDY